MSILSIIVTYFLTWWVIIFLVIPSANQRKEEGGQYPDPPNIPQKILVTSGISAIITLAIWALVRLDIFSFRQWADQWN